MSSLTTSINLLLPSFLHPPSSCHTPSFPSLTTSINLLSLSPLSHHTLMSYSTASINLLTPSALRPPRLHHTLMSSLTTFRNLLFDLPLPILLPGISILSIGSKLVVYVYKSISR
ncbi:hypothetical protein SK128_024915 [Halocaridina rubra]|uniref:Uncharacterized protein n=1 Tax=Halocaridina rubra TaxID=373956 RepID=A0AAN8XF60_HALRR